MAEEFKPNLVVNFHHDDGSVVGIDFRLTDPDLALPLDDFCDRLLKPAFNVFLRKIAEKRARPDG